MSFAEMSQKATRRAASAFSFELLVLGTRDCIKLSQNSPFETSRSGGHWGTRLQACKIGLNTAHCNPGLEISFPDTR